MGYPFKVTIFQAICRKVRGYPITILIKLIENRYKITIFPASSRKYCNFSRNLGLEFMVYVICHMSSYICHSSE